MARYAITHTTTYNYTDMVPVCHNLVHLTPRSLPHQNVEQTELMVNPATSHRSRRIDYYGNVIDYLQIEEPHRQLKITSKSTINISERPPFISGDGRGENLSQFKELPWEQMTTLLATEKDPVWYEAYQYGLPSPRISPLAEAARYARPSFTAGRGLIEAATDLMRRIHRDFEFDDTASDVLTPTAEIFRKRKGVCQDFAHLQIACLRSLGLAARYVSGYLRTYPPPGRPRLIGADASHAWVSLFVGAGGWIELDPTNDSIPSTDHIVVAYGRDFSDVSPIDGVFIGGGDHKLAVSVDVAPLEEAA